MIENIPGEVLAVEYKESKKLMDDDPQGYKEITLRYADRAVTLVAHDDSCGCCAWEGPTLRFDES